MKFRERKCCGGGARSALPALNQSADLAPEVRGMVKGTGGEVRTADWKPQKGRVK